MSIETLSSELVRDEVQIDSVQATKLGATVFEILAVDARSAENLPEGIEDGKIFSSVTRRGDGQTVPDER